MNVSKGHLSRFLGTRCERSLYLSLHDRTECEARGLPEPLSARPEVRHLHAAGIELENACFRRLRNAFPGLCVGAEPEPDEGGTVASVPLHTALMNLQDGAAVVIQPEFHLEDDRVRFLTSLGVTERDLRRIPPLASQIPDIVGVDIGAIGRDGGPVFAVTPEGDRVPVGARDTRRRLVVIDIKHAREASTGYESEVAFYAVALSGWLRARGLDDHYLVSSAICLWTGGGIAKGEFATAAHDKDATTEQRLDALRSELSPINTPIYLQAIRRFLGEQLPDILARGEDDFDSLEWHVGSRCGTCDWLGHPDWLSREDRERVARNRGGYCLSKAHDTDHLSRVPMISRGARRVLEEHGVPTVGKLALKRGDDEVFRQHSALKRDRRALPAYAKAIDSGSTVVDEVRVDGTLARYPDLDVFVTVNFDVGAGQLTGLAVDARFRQHASSRGESGESGIPWRKQWIVDRKSPECEGDRVREFLRYLAFICDWVCDTDPEKGGPHARDTTAQLIFWDRRQHRELCLAVGRHLPVILYGDEDRTVKALVWLFPPLELLQHGAVDPRKPGVAFIRDVVRRLVRVPALHELTLFGVAEHYRWGKQFHAPDAMYREPLSDAIPRERIYEIWTAAAAGPGSTVRRGSKRYGLDALKTAFRRTLRTQAHGLRLIAWRLRQDFARRLRATGPLLDVNVPRWMEGVAYEAKLWIAWCAFSKAFDDVMTERSFLDDPEEIEARYEGLRLMELVEEHADGSLEFTVSPESRDAKFRAPQAFLAVSVDDIPGFLSRRVFEVIGLPGTLDTSRNRNRPMSTVLKAELLEFDREALRARIAWDNFGTSDRELRRAVVCALGDQIRRNVTLMSAAGPDVQLRRLTRTLEAIGDPGIAQPSENTLAALGRAGVKILPGQSPMTPAAAVLWDPVRLNGERARSTEAAAEIAEAAVRTSSPPLDDSQRAAIASAVSRRLSVIWGPPGTGKTGTCAAMVHQLANHEARGDSDRSYNILLTGPNYKAVAELAERVMRRMSKDKGADARFFIVHREGREDEFQVPAETVARFAVRTTTANPGNPVFCEMIRSLTDDLDTTDKPNVNIVAAVVHQCPKISEQAARMDDGDPVMRPLFDFVLIDESSQADMSIAIPPLALLRDEFQLVLAGDLLQMPPVSQCDPPVGAENLVGSIQRYLVEQFPVSQETLLRNYRSAGEIVEFTKGLGYPEELEAVFPNARLSTLSDAAECGKDLEAADLALSDGWGAVLDPKKRIVAITYRDGVSGQANPFEADCVASLVYLLRKTASAKLACHRDEGEGGPHDAERFWRTGVGVVTPHRAQRAAIVRSLRRTFPDDEGEWIEGAVDTVERFQGGERHTIIVSFGVGDPDLIAGEEKFLMQLERTNVAISRAMAKCIVFLSEEIAAHIPADRNAIMTAHALKGVVDEWCKDREEAIVLSRTHGRRRITIRSRPAPSSKADRYG